MVPPPSARSTAFNARGAFLFMSFPATLQKGRDYVLSNIVAHTAPMEVHRMTATDAERAEFRAHMDAVAPPPVESIDQHRLTTARVRESVQRISDPANLW